MHAYNKNLRNATIRHCLCSVINWVYSVNNQFSFCFCTSEVSSHRTMQWNNRWFVQFVAVKTFWKVWWACRHTCSNLAELIIREETVANSSRKSLAGCVNIELRGSTQRKLFYRCHVWLWDQMTIYPPCKEPCGDACSPFLTSKG